MLTIRLEKEIENRLSRAAKMIGVSKSEIVRRSLSVFFKSTDQNNAWELGKHLFGNYNSGKGNLSVDAKKIFKSRLQSKSK